MWNALQPISKLPAELLAKIFAHLVRREDLVHYHRGLHWHARVCTRWADIIKGTPALWSVIHSNDPIGVIQRTLERSRQIPLDFVCDKPNPPKDLEPVFRVLAPHAHRWRSVDLSGVTDFERCLSVQAPLLETVKISYRGNPTMLTVPAVSGLMAQLRHLHLRTINVEWCLLQLPQLLTLDLGFTTGLYPACLINILRGSPDLEDLRLNLLDGDDEIVYEEPKAPAHLHKLQRLDLDDLSAWYMHPVLANIRTPHCTTFRISDYRNYDQEPHAIFDSATHHLDEVIVKILRNSNNPPVITATWDSFALSSNSFPAGLDLDLGVRLPEAPMPVHLVASAPDVEIGLVVERTSRVKDILEVLTDNANIYSLIISSSIDEDPSEFLEFLGTPDVGCDDSIRWPLPGLRELEIYDTSITPKAILDMATARYSSSGDLSRTTPTPLSRLDLEGLGLDFADQETIALNNIFGPGVVIFSETSRSPSP